MMLEISFIVLFPVLAVCDFTHCGIFTKEVSRCPKDFGRVIGGYSAWHWPWTVQIIISRKIKSSDGVLQSCDSFEYHETFCGATIIDKYNLVTASHCLWPLENVCFVKFKLGAYEDFKRRQGFRTIYVRNENGKIIVHENYTKTKNGDDIALIQLDQPIQFGPSGSDKTAVNLGPVCLPSKPESVNTSDCFAVGWGMVDPCFEEYPTHLKQAAIPILDDYTCGKSLDKNGEIYRPESQVCAGHLQSGAPDTCKGDSVGGPLVCRMKAGYWGSDQPSWGPWFLMGITSFGSYPCATPDYPGVYTRVSNYLTWIEQNKKQVVDNSEANRKPRRTWHDVKDPVRIITEEPPEDVKETTTTTEAEKTTTEEDEDYEPRPKTRKPRRKARKPPSQSGTSIVINNENYND